MTKLLEKAFREASRLPVPEQDLIAQGLLDDIRAEAKWDDSFADSSEELGNMADEALNDLRDGRAKPLQEIL